MTKLMNIPKNDWFKKFQEDAGKYLYGEQDANSLGIRTHARYARNIYVLIKDEKLVFSVGQQTNNPLKKIEKIVNKLNIVRYTLESIRKEYDFANSDEEFLSISLSWLWIKGYYIIFHLLSLLAALIKSDERYLFDKKYNAHSKIIEVANEILFQHKPFSTTELNQGFTGRILKEFNTTDHKNLKNVALFDSDLYKTSLKKVWKDEKFRLKGKKSEQVKLLNKRYSIFNFMLNYRERFNYTGFHYLDSDIPYNKTELKEFYISSYFVICAITQALACFLCNQTSGKLKIKFEEISKI